MVELCRVDDRMLHGQVAVTWVNQVAPDAILIANDEAATNEMSKLAHLHIAGLAGNAADSVIGDFDFNGFPPPRQKNKSSGAG